MQVIFLIRFAAGAALGWEGDSVGDLVRIAIGALSWTAATFFAYLLNGATDITEDRINGSRRPIATGRLDPDAAVVVAYAAAAVATVGAFAVGPTTGLLMAIFLLCGYAYSGRPFQLKRSSGSAAAVVLLAGLTTYAAGFSTVGPIRAQGGELAVFGAAMSLWMGMVGTTAKDFSDLTGDRVAGRRPAALVWGESVARLVLGAAALALGCGFALVAAWWFPGLLAPALMLLAGSLVVAPLALVQRWSSGNRSASRRPYRTFMATQYCTHLCLFGTVFL